MVQLEADLAGERMARELRQTIDNERATADAQRHQLLAAQAPAAHAHANMHTHSHTHTHTHSHTHTYTRTRTRTLTWLCHAAVVRVRASGLARALRRSSSN